MNKVQADEQGASRFTGVDICASRCASVDICAGVDIRTKIEAFLVEQKYHINN